MNFRENKNINIAIAKEIRTMCTEGRTDTGIPITVTSKDYTSGVEHCKYCDCLRATNLIVERGCVRFNGKTSYFERRSGLCPYCSHVLEYLTVEHYKK